ncbi:hypothetical protein Leryth_011740 [Lithospermum erythrorhizon]|nr:hypothetical protein Leryth_011740 [Lithospermum erythrorhizon]
MYSCCSCFSHHRFRLYYKPSLLSYTFLNLNPKQIYILKPFNLCKTMSSTSKKSAFDILMSNASKKKTQQTHKSSPQKRKIQELNAQIQNPSDEKPVFENTINVKSSKNVELSGDCLGLSKIRDAQIEKGVKNVGKEESSSVKSSENVELGGDCADLRKMGCAQIEKGEKFGGKDESSSVKSSKNVEFELGGDCLGLRKMEDAQIEKGEKNVGKEEGSSGKRRKLSPDESVNELKKKASNFDPKKAAYWGDGERVPFMFVVKGLDAISQVSGRIVMTEILCNMLRTVMETTPDDLVAFVYLLGNRIAPAHEGMELGLGDASIIKALAEACGAKEAHIKKQYKELGDLGLVAKASRSSQPLMRKPESLTVAKVLDTFHIIAKESGNNSQEKKKNHIKSLLVAATDCEPLYLIRLLQTKLRIGLAEQTLLTALGHAAFYSGKNFSSPKHVESPLEEAAKIVKQVYSVIPVYDKIIPALLAGGVWDLPKTCSFSPGVPIGPMLAKPTKGVSEILDKFQDMEFTCEYKYDGERAQIHYLDNGSVEIYSRNAERNTGKFPDVVAAVTRLKNPSVTSFVLDCELVAFDREKQKILPFQVLSTRARKNVVMSEIKVEVCIFAFDLLYLNGQSLLQDQLNIRREKLYKSFKEELAFFQFATAISSNDLEEIQKFLETAVNSRCPCTLYLMFNTLALLHD